MFALGAVILRAFENVGLAGRHSWSAAGGRCAAGLSADLLVDEPGTDSPGVAHKFTTDVVITDQLEKAARRSRLHSAVPLLRWTPYAAFYSVPSVQEPRVMDRAAANANARLSSMIPYMLCVSRFAHYIKVMARDRVGS